MARTLEATVKFFPAAWNYNANYNTNDRLFLNMANMASKIKIERGSEFSSYENELQNRVTQNDVTLRVTNWKSFIEILLSSY